ncbi:hypothetical protein EBS02_11735 [bacterium]|nr:hypothetical protein [bacterium]
MLKRKAARFAQGSKIIGSFFNHDEFISSCVSIVKASDCTISIIVID